MEAIFFLWELLKECLQQCLIPESLGIVRKFQWTGGGGGGEESSLSNVKTLNRLVLGSQPGKGFQNQGIAQRTTEELTAKMVSINIGLHKLSYLTFMKLKI